MSSSAAHRGGTGPETGRPASHTLATWARARPTPVTAGAREGRPETRGHCSAASPGLLPARPLLPPGMSLPRVSLVSNCLPSRLVLARLSGRKTTQAKPHVWCPQDCAHVKNTQGRHASVRESQGPRRPAATWDSEAPRRTALGPHHAAGACAFSLTTEGHVDECSVTSAAVCALCGCRSRWWFRAPLPPRRGGTKPGDREQVWGGAGLLPLLAVFLEGKKGGK